MVAPSDVRPCGTRLAPKPPVPVKVVKSLPAWRAPPLSA